MRSVEDIDEDEPAPIVIGMPAGNNSNNNNNASSNNNGSVMDDLFGPSTSAPATSLSSTSANNHQQHSTPQQFSQQSPVVGAHKQSDALDDFFGGNNIRKNPTSTTAPFSVNAGPSNANKAPDVFDSLFSTNNNNNNNSHANSNNIFGSVNNNNNNTSYQSTTSASSTGGVGGLGARSALDQLDAFSALSRGAAVPWKQNTSVADSQTKVLDIFGGGGGNGSDLGGDEGRGVFIPPDQVLSLMTLYDVVGAAQNWTVEDISKAYKKKAILLHPDKLPGGKRTEREDRYFKIITAAYDVLKDKDKRAEYDAALKRGAGSQGSWLNFVV